MEIQGSKRSLIMKNLGCSILCIVFAFVLICESATAQYQASDSLAYRQFDFWIGEWNVYHYSADTLVGSSQISSIVGGRGIRELYTTPSGYDGTSLNKYNTQSKSWEQFWVDNTGTTLFIRGALIDGKMVMMDVNTSVGQPMNRITWIQEAEGTVRQTWDVSADGGAIWTTIFDGKYKRK